jgi:hypothetical protein
LIREGISLFCRVRHDYPRTIQTELIQYGKELQTCWRKKNLVNVQRNWQFSLLRLTRSLRTLGLD